MSGKLVGQVYELDLPHNEQSIMLALADHGHDDGSHIHPSVGYLAWKTGYTERQVQTILRRLEEKGLIEPVAYVTGGRGKATEYQMHIERGTKKPPYRPAKGEAITSPYSDAKGEVMSSPYQKGEVLKRVKSASQKGEVSHAKGEVPAQKGEVIASPQPSKTKTLREPEEEPRDSGAASAPPLSEPSAPPDNPPSKPPSRKREPKLSPDEQAYFAATVPVMAEACCIDLAVEGAWAKCQKQLRALYHATTRPTADLLRREYIQPTGYWYTHDWRGLKGQSPEPQHIAATWGAATTYRDKSNGHARAAPGGGPRLTQYERNMQILYGDEPPDVPPASQGHVIDGRVRYGN